MTEEVSPHRQHGDNVRMPGARRLGECRQQGVDEGALAVHVPAQRVELLELVGDQQQL
jgi:hypothetical protein